MVLAGADASCGFDRRAVDVGGCEKHHRHFHDGHEDEDQHRRYQREFNGGRTVGRVDKTVQKAFEGAGQVDHAYSLAVICEVIFKVFLRPIIV